jgi:hypothetical protein
MAAFLMVWLALSNESSAYVRGIGGVVFGLGVYWIVAILLGVPDAREIPASLIKRSQV